MTRSPIPYELDCLELDLDVKLEGALPHRPDTVEMVAAAQQPEAKSARSRVFIREVAGRGIHFAGKIMRGFDIER